VEQLPDPGAGHAGDSLSIQQMDLDWVRIYVVVDRRPQLPPALASAPMAREELSYCRICAAACGITVTVDGERVVRVRGDAGHPVSRGYTCSKGRGLPAWHHDPARLDRPRVRGREVDWDEALDDLGAVLRDRVAACGADAVALYLATGMAYDSAGQLATGMFLGALGTSSFYSAVTVDNAPVLVAAELVTGNAMMSPRWDPSGRGLFLLVGTNPVVSHGYGTTIPDPLGYLRDFRRAGGRVWVVDPRRTESAMAADRHLATRPGSDVVVLAALARALLERGADDDELRHHCAPEDVDALRRVLDPFTIARAADAADVAPAVLHALVDDLRAHQGQVAVSCGTGALMGADGVLVEWLKWVLLIVTGSLDRPGGMRISRGTLTQLRPPRHGRAARPPRPGPASRPELPRVTNQIPAVALADEIEAGNVRVLIVTGGNPILALPEPDRVRAALRALDALVVVDVMENELTELATHVLPVTGQLERADVSLLSHMSVRPTAQSTAAVVPPGAERRPAWWVLANLGSRMGIDLLGGVDPDSLTDEAYLRGIVEHSPLDADEVFSAGSRGFDLPVEFGWVHESMLPGGRWNLAPTLLVERLATHREPGPGLVLSPARDMAWSNSVRYGTDDDSARLRVHPDDAAAAGVADGARASVVSEHGAVDVVVVVDDRMRAGVVSLVHGRRDRSPGKLTSARIDVDPLTTMPRASGIRVRVQATVEAQVAAT
jgi:anaerobic selenocysteine-containing dehydrogenase